MKYIFNIFGGIFMCHGKVRILWLTQVLEMIDCHFLINEDQINEFEIKLLNHAIDK